MILWLNNHFIWRFSQFGYIFTWVGLILHSSTRISFWNLGNYWNWIYDGSCVMCSQRREMSLNLVAGFVFPSACPEGGYLTLRISTLMLLLVFPCFRWRCCLFTLAGELHSVHQFLAFSSPAVDSVGTYSNLQWLIAIWFQLNVYLQYKSQ